MNESFQTAVERIYSNTDDIESLYIPSFGKHESVLKSLSLYNLYNQTIRQEYNIEEDKNLYRCSIEESVNKNRNSIKTYLLNNNATEEDFFEAFHAAALIGDDDLLQEVNERYTSYSGSYTGFSEQMFKYMNDCIHRDNTVKSDDIITSNAKKNISEYLNDPFLDVTFTELNNLYASITYLLLTENHDCDNMLGELYSYFVEDDNEYIMLFEPDVSLEYYCKILKEIREMLSITDNEDLFEKFVTETKGQLMFESLSYDITTPFTFELYIAALAYSDITISDQQFQQLSQLHRQIKNSVSMNNYQAVSYLNFAANYLNLSLIELPVMDDEKSYYYLCTTGQYKELGEFTYSGDDIVELLQICDRAIANDDLTRVLNQIDIWQYADEDSFPQILNLYICAMARGDLITEELKDKTLCFLSEAECSFGYAERAGNYDFRTSVFFTNIKYILMEGIDIGLR